MGVGIGCLLFPLCVLGLCACGVFLYFSCFWRSFSSFVSLSFVCIYPPFHDCIQYISWQGEKVQLSSIMLCLCVLLRSRVATVFEARHLLCFSVW
jgi:hypothetical protein